MFLHEKSDPKMQNLNNEIKIKSIMRNTYWIANSPYVRIRTLISCTCFGQNKISLKWVVKMQM